MKHWTLEQIHWTRFDPARVDPEIVKLVKAAAMVEFNGGDYATYLNRVFADDPEFQAVATAWAQEEVQHGQALARWAKLADPGTEAFEVGTFVNYGEVFPGDQRSPAAGVVTAFARVEGRWVKL